MKNLAIFILPILVTACSGNAPRTNLQEQAALHSVIYSSADRAPRCHQPERHISRSARDKYCEVRGSQLYCMSYC